MIRLGKWLLVFAVLVFVAATAWWYVFFEQMLGENVKQASECFYFESDLCAIGNLAGRLGEIPPYTPFAFWGAVGLFGMGLLAIILGPRH